MLLVFHSPLIFLKEIIKVQEMTLEPMPLLVVVGVKVISTTNQFKQVVKCHKEVLLL